MREELQALKEQALAELGAVTTPDELKDLRIKYLGKKGPMTEILRGMGALPAEERPKIGQIVNEVKSALETAINAKTEVLEAESLKARLANEKVDITLPGRTQNCGHLHPRYHPNLYSAVLTRLTLRLQTKAFSANTHE